MRILLFGSSGLLGKELTKNNEHVFLTPSHSDIDIMDIDRLTRYIKAHNPDLVINAAAIIDNRRIEQEPKYAIGTNIIGASNVALLCDVLNIRLVYISTDYIYEGGHGNYKEEDPILPFNNYAWSKLGGECAVRLVKNHLIIRTSFGGNKFPYDVAFTDKWSSKEYVDKIAPQILEAAISPLTGVLNIGSERKTIYDHASERSCVSPIKLSETSHRTPYDTSLNLQKWINYKSSKPIAKPHTNCRCCGSDKLVKYLDLGLMPLANNLETTSIRAKEVERFPLQVMFCEDCGLSQLSVVIDPVKMYGFYVYRSSVNGGYVKHCNQMAKDILQSTFRDKGLFHIDIAGNDGTLLREFVKAYRELGWKDGYDTLNVDPASNLAAISEASGIDSIVDFWGVEVGKKVLDKYGEADLITATNVFAHVSDIRGFIEVAKSCLKPEGMIVIECPYLIDFIEEMEFNQTYFEHLSIMSVSPIVTLCKSLQMRVCDVRKQNIHGGTIRVCITHENEYSVVLPSVKIFTDKENEQGFLSFNLYSQWSKKVNEITKIAASELLALKKAGHKISGMGASAKGVTFLCAMGINTDILDYICDDTSEKIGKFSPGSGIPIVYTQELLKNPPDYLLILSENFKDDLAKRARSVGYKGKFIVGLPTWEIFE